MTRNTPQFSVIIPLYNKEKFVQRAIRSVLGQEFANFEVIIVDDGSTDHSMAVVDELAKLDSRILPIRQANEGGSGGPARNTGMAHANGEWFAFLDADDAWLSNHLSELHAIVTCHPSSVMVATRSVESYGGETIAIDKSDRAISDINYFNAAAHDIGIVNSSCVAVSRAGYARVGEFSAGKSGIDLEYWARLALKGDVAISRRITSIYYRNTGGNMETLSLERRIQPPDNDFTDFGDLSPSLAMLKRAAKYDPTLLQRSDIRRYINSRARAGVSAALVANESKKALKVSRLLMSPLTLRDYALYGLALMPTTIRHCGINCYRRLKRIYS